MSVIITDKEPKPVDINEANVVRRGSADLSASVSTCFEQPTLGQALRDGKPGDIDYVNSFLHLLAQQQKIRKEQQAYPQPTQSVAGGDDSSDDCSESDDDDYRRRRGWKKRKLIWKDTYPPLKKGVRKKNRYKRRRSKDASSMQHSILQSLAQHQNTNGGGGAAAQPPIQTSDGTTSPRESSMPDVRDMVSPSAIAALETQQQLGQQNMHNPAPPPCPSPYAVPLATGASLQSMAPPASTAMHPTKRELDEIAMLEQSLLVHPHMTRCAEQQQQQQVAEEIMAEGRHGQLTAAINPLIQHVPPSHSQHHHQMWQRAMNALPDCGGMTDEHVDEFYGQRLWAQFEDIFDTEAMAGIEESLQTASIQAHIPTLAAGGASTGFGNCKSATSANQGWDEFFNE